MSIIVQASEIAQFLKLPLQGRGDIPLKRPCSMERTLLSGGLVFVTAWTPDILIRLNFIQDILALVPNTKRSPGKLDFSYIECQNPRLSFARVVRRFFTKKITPHIAETAIVDETADIGEGVSIGHYSVVGANVVIGDNTVIRNHVVIADDTVIGSNCTLKSGCVVGEDGFGFEFDQRSHHPERIPHTGHVVISDFVEVGANTVICRGTLDNTLLGPHCKLDDLVFIAHNVEIDRDSLIIAHAEISGSAHIGQGAWIGPGAVVKEHVNVGDNALVGIGAVVLKDVENGAVVVGNPAKFLRERNK